MMLVGSKLACHPRHTHIGLLDAIDKIEPGLVERVVTRGHAGARRPRQSKDRRLRYQPARREKMGSRCRGEEATGIAPAIEACGRTKGVLCKARCLRTRCFFSPAEATTTWS